ncbi:RNA-dependent RNA polymerase [Erysiphe necator associated narnavirus 22]|nr:RNA-dependent RNA polymerase [Erysiphe necator associated narnavirus 22]
MSKTSNFGTPFLKGGSGEQPLPEVYHFNTPFKDVSKKEILSGVKNSYYVHLCTRLAVCRRTKSWQVYEPRNFGFYGAKRLYRMIGYRLKPTVFKRFSLISSEQWKMIEESWTAIMHTVLLHTEFNPLSRDKELVKNIINFKLWFIEFSTKGRIIRGKNTRVQLFQIEKLLKGLKAISGWFQYYALDFKELNSLAPSLPWFPGWKSGRPTFVWFGGHLSHFRDLERPLSDLDIRSLCQIRTFGRALPPPTTKMVINDLVDQVKVLTEPKIHPEGVLDTVSSFSRRLFERLNVKDLTYKTHISVSTSGCFEVSQRKGGMAAYVRGWIEELNVPVRNVRIAHNDGLDYDLIDHFIENTVDTYRDCYGLRVFPRRSMLIDLEDNEDLSLLSCLYRQAGHSVIRSAGERWKEGLLPPETCPAILLCASSEAIQQGYFAFRSGKERHPDIWILLPSGRRLPLWDRPISLRYIPVDSPRVQMLSLAEPGAKCRSLGKCQTWFVIVTKIMRFMIEPILALDGRARIGLASTNKMWSFLKYLQNNRRNGWFQSTDYKAATDHMSLELLKAIWEPCFEQVDPRHPFLVYKQLMFEKRKLVFSKKFESSDNGKEHCCGSFMGEPMSFMSLTTYNLLVEEISEYVFRGWDYPIKPTNLIGNEPLAICGDDVASERKELNRILSFKKVVKDTGMVLSWKDGISRRLLIFCEDHILCDNTGKLLYIDVIKSRLLTTMSRQHSDNRSSILGKGKMLNNQLAYLTDKTLQIFVMQIYNSIFSREYNNLFKGMKLPYFFPPNAGGIGYPILDLEIPKWSTWMFGYIEEVLQSDDYNYRMVVLHDLSRHNFRNKHGMDNTKKAIELFSHLTHGKGIIFIPEGEVENFYPYTVYGEKVIRNLLKRNNINVPSDIYGNFDRDNFTIVLQTLGIIPFRDYIDNIDRVLNFNEALSSVVLRKQRTVNDWVKTSSRFWGRLYRSLSQEKLRQLQLLGLDTMKSSMESLSKRIDRAFDGYVIPSIWESVPEFGPSLQIDFLKLSRKPRTRFFKRNLEWNIHSVEKDFPDARDVYDTSGESILVRPE